MSVFKINYLFFKFKNFIFQFLLHNISFHDGTMEQCVFVVEQLFDAQSAGAPEVPYFSGHLHAGKKWT